MKKIKQSHFLGFYNALIEGDKNQCTHLVQSLIDDGVDVKDIYVHLFQESLYGLENFGTIINCRYLKNIWQPR